MRRVSGLTLVELLLSIGLAVFLVLAILQVYRIGKSVYRWQVEIALLEENGRHALGLLQRELAMAGFFGRQALRNLPAPGAAAPVCAAGDGWVLDPAAPIDVLDDFSGGPPQFASGARLTCLPESRLVHGSDAIAVKRTAALPSRAAAGEPALRDLTPSRWYLTTGAPGGPRTVFVDDAGDAWPLVSAGATWWELRTTVFYLRDYSQSPQDGIPTLCSERLRSDMRSVCLVEGVEVLQVAFGVDTDGDGVPNTLTTSPSTAQLATAVTARVHLLVRSVRALYRRPQARSFQLGTVRVDLPADRYFRRVFSATVRLRNVQAQAGWRDEE